MPPQRGAIQTTAGPVSAASLIGSERGHAVQFYLDDAFLATSVADFLAGGLAAGQPLLSIATAAHGNAVARRLAALGVDVAAERRAGRLTMLDAGETLAAFMRGTEPDADRFREVIGGALEQCRGGQADRVVRAFGEMVDLLWQNGNPEGAIRLETLWNELAADEPFGLLCGYSMDNFADAAQAERFREVCGQHRHVLPAESYTRGSDAERLVAISVLQQRARALETELARRAQLEQLLRDALTERDRLLEEERAARSDAERARLAAQEANRAKSAFLAVMSHELRTPLNAIGGYVELLEMGVFGALADSQQEVLARIQRSERHLLELIDQVLSYAHVESGALRYEITDVPMHEVLRAADSLALPQMRAKGITYRRAEDDESIVARADAEKVRQIVLNLLTNATKFTRVGGHVAIECEAAEDAVIVRVRDDGIGIAAAKLDAVFEPFVQADSEFTREQGGVGLGLAISRDLARGMGGELTVASVVGEGSVFTLTLPRA